MRNRVHVTIFGVCCALSAPPLALFTSTGLANDVLAPAAEQASPAQHGWHFLIEKNYGKPTLTEQRFEQLWKTWPEPLKREAEQASTERRREMAFSRYGFVADPDPDSTRTAPLNVADSGDGQWTLNCLSCHQGKVAGRVVPGVPNSLFAFQTLANDLVNLRRLEGSQPTLGELSLAFAALGRTNGTTNAQIFSVALVARRDKDLNVQPTNSFPKMINHDLDAPPLWNTSRKRRLYIDGFPEKTARVIMQFVLSESNSGETIRNWEDDFDDILAWIESLQPPKYPWDVDQQLAATGEKLFEQTCAGCHGTYGPDGEYPEKRIPIADIGTDPLRLQGMPVEHRQFFKESWFGDYGQRTVVEDPEGYVAPPLNGVWASAPYFHNGSVPTLWHVLHPDQRPQVWLRTEDGYDTQRVGLEVSEFEELPKAAKSRPDERRRYFDTSLPGKSAQGHTYPDELSDDEKRAVLEYLKTM